MTQNVPNDGHLCEEDVLMGFFEVSCFKVAATTLDKQTVHIYSILGFLSDFILEVWPDFSVEHKGINSNMSPSGISLHSSCHEALREEESRSPVRVHRPILDPLPEETDPFNKIVDPRGERFKGRIGYVFPNLRHFLVKERSEHFLKLNAHQQSSFNCFLQVTQRSLHDS